MNLKPNKPVGAIAFGKGSPDAGAMAGQASP